MRQDNRGFSLTEVLMVLLISAVLITVTAGIVMHRFESSKETSDKQLAQSVKMTIAATILQYGEHPELCPMEEPVLIQRIEEDGVLYENLATVLGYGPFEIPEHFLSKSYKNGAMFYQIDGDYHVTVMLSEDATPDGITYWTN